MGFIAHTVLVVAQPLSAASSPADMGGWTSWHLACASLVQGISPAWRKHFVSWLQLVTTINTAILW